MRAERDNLHALTAVTDASAQRAESIGGELTWLCPRCPVTLGEGHLRDRQRSGFWLNHTAGRAWTWLILREEDPAGWPVVRFVGETVSL